MNIDVLITGSSRPFLIGYTFDAFEEKVKLTTGGQKRYLLHEDAVFPKKSLEVISWAKTFKEFSIVEMAVPKLGLGKVLDKMLPLIQTDYMFYLQDDWEFERFVDLGQILWVMDRNPEINLIAFGKFRNLGTINGFDQEEFNFNGLRLCLINSWTFVPGVWRMSFVRKMWESRDHRPEGYFTNKLGTRSQRTNKKYCIENLGAYLYGSRGDYRYIRHIGDSWRMADWQLKEGKPSGGIECTFVDEVMFRAPWLDPMPDRPINPAVLGKLDLGKLRSSARNKVVAYFRRLAEKGDISDYPEEVKRYMIDGKS